MHWGAQCNTHNTRASFARKNWINFDWSSAALYNILKVDYTHTHRAYNRAEKWINKCANKEKGIERERERYNFLAKRERESASCNSTDIRINPKYYQRESSNSGLHTALHTLNNSTSRAKRENNHNNNNNDNNASPPRAASGAPSFLRASVRFCLPLHVRCRQILFQFFIPRAQRTRLISERHSFALLIKKTKKKRNALSRARER